MKISAQKNINFYFIHKTSLIYWLLVLYVLSFGFIDIFEFPIVGKKLQLPELIFIGVLIVFIPIYFSSFKWHYFKNKSFSPIIKSLLFLFLAVLISTIYHHQIKNILEFIGLLYLFGLFFIFKTIFIEVIPKYQNRIFQYFTISALILAISGILGWILTQNGIETPLAFSSEMYYPYFGYIGRAKGFCPTPALYVNILGSLFLLKFAQVLIQPKKYDYWVLGIIILGIIFSFSKSIILLIISCLIVFRFSKKSPYFSNKMYYSVLIVLFLFFNFATHFLIVNPQKIQTEKTLKDNTFIAKEPIIEWEKYWLVETNYALMKKSNSIAFFRNPILGLGLGGHNDFVNNLGNESAYKADFNGEMADPHSTYFGIFSETGLFGGIVLMFLIWIIFREFSFLISIENPKYPVFILGLLGAFSFFLMEGISTDMLNFRHLWVLLAFLAALLILEKQNIKT